MGLFKKLKKQAKGLASKADDLIDEHGDQIDKAIDKAADVVDDKTGHRHSDKIDKAAEGARKLVDKLDKDDDEPGGAGAAPEPR